MPQLPEDSIEVVKPKLPLWRRLRAWAVVGLLYGIVLGMAWGGVALVRHGLRRGIALEDRALPLIFAALMLVFPLAVVWQLVKVKWTTGRWLRSKEENAKRVAICRVKSVERKRLNAVAANPWSWLGDAVGLAGRVASDNSEPWWKRGVGWVVLGAAVLAVLAVFGFGLICIGAAFADDNTLTQGLVFGGIGVGILAYGVYLVRSKWRRRREFGSWWLTPDEIAERSELRKLQHVREWQKPTGSKVASLAASAVVFAVLWGRVVLLHQHHRHVDWTFLAVYTPLAVWAWVRQFVKPKGVAVSDVRIREGEAV